MRQKILTISSVILFFSLVFVLGAPNGAVRAVSAPTINILSKSNSVGKFEKFEANAEVVTSSLNPFLPFDPMTTPIPGLSGGFGVSVDGQFLPPGETNWSKAIQQPAFFFREYSENGTLFTPTGVNYWKLRFAPDKVGNWQFRMVVSDAGGTVQTAGQTFSVGESTNPGFVRVSQQDPRYFEFSNGSYFPSLGVNDINILSDSGSTSNLTNMQNLSANGIQLLRFWLSGWSIWGSQWTSWESVKNTYDGYLPRSGLITNNAQSKPAEPSSVLGLAYAESAGGEQNSGNWFDACTISVTGGGQIRFGTTAGKTYHIKIRYKTSGISGGPRVSDPAKFPNNDNFGFVLKGQNPNDGTWHGNQAPLANRCWNYSSNNANSGVRMTPYGRATDWTNLEADWTASGTTTPLLYLALENVKDNSRNGGDVPMAYIDSIEIREKLAGETLGPNIVFRNSMSYLEQINDRNAYAFDKVLEFARTAGIYFKTVIMEKDEQVENEINFNGQKALYNSANVFGNWRNETAVRWYQKAWWRYLQARWGYSTNIQSWELFNEGAVGNGNHYTLADELGKFMHCLAFGVTTDANGGSLTVPADGKKCSYNHPNAHMVTTSFWYGFFKNEFWDNRVTPPPNPGGNTYGSWYPNVDYADIHDYINLPSEPQNFYDTALANFNLGQSFGAKQPGGANKPLVRGETGLISDDGTDAIAGNLDSKGVWLHNFLWGSINQYGAIGLWWHISQIGNKWPIFKPYYDFIKNVPLNKGGYVDAGANVTDANVRVWGQKNPSVNLAHLWAQNKKHQWCSVAGIQNSYCPNWDGSRLNGTVTVSGFSPNLQNLPVEWWMFDNNVVLTKSAGTVSSNQNGQITLDLSALPQSVTDVGIKIGNYDSPSMGVPLDGDSNNDGVRNALDLKTILGNYLKAVSAKLDQFQDAKINAFDFMVVLKRLP